MNWTEFVLACKHFLTLSEQYGDSWREEGDPKNPSEYFISLRTLRKTCSSSSDDDDSSSTLLSCRFDVIFSISYSVPVMYFQMSKSDGSSLAIEEIWKLVNVSSQDLWSTVSQMDHPVLQVPFYAFHACQTEKLMETLCSSLSTENDAEKDGDGSSRKKKDLKPHEYLISWLSFMASILQFHFPHEYILNCVSTTSK